MTKTLTALAVLTLPLLLAVLSLAVHCNRDATPTPDPLAEELAEITARYNRDWDARRDDVADEAARQQMRKQWRRAHHAEVRECCKRHNRPVPVWARE